jgi:hypothetical protein
MQLENDAEMTCPLSYQTATGVTVDDRAELNLCTKIPQLDSECTNQQGMLSQTQYDGYPTNNVYKKSTASSSVFLPARIRENTLFRGNSPEQGKLSNLVLSPDDIGGHLVLVVLSTTQGGKGALDITGLQLSSYSHGLSDEAFGQS